MRKKSPPAAEPQWRKLERYIQRLFKQKEGVKVTPDAVVKGKSGEKRKLELWITWPFVIELSEHFRITLPLRIAVDCKHLAKPVDINEVGAFIDQMDDVGAHAGIMVATGGFGKGARARAKARSIFLVDTPPDLLVLARGLALDDFFQCKCCGEDDDDGDHMPGVVEWHASKFNDHAPAIGTCSRCSAPHAMCSDCAEVVGFYEAEFSKWVECPGGCGRLFNSEYDHRDMVATTRSIGPVERWVLLEAAKHKGRLAFSEFKERIAGTKWQYAHGKAKPLGRMISEGWISGRGSKDEIRLTEEGRVLAEQELPHAQHSAYGW